MICCKDINDNFLTFSLRKKSKFDKEFLSKYNEGKVRYSVQLKLRKIVGVENFLIYDRNKSDRSGKVENFVIFSNKKWI